MLSWYLKRTSPLPAAALVPSMMPLQVGDEKAAWMPASAPYVRCWLASYRTARIFTGEKVTMMSTVPALPDTVHPYGWPAAKLLPTEVIVPMGLASPVPLLNLPDICRSGQRIVALVLTSMKRWLCPLPENEAKLPPGMTVQVAVAAATWATLPAIVSSEAAAVEGTGSRPSFARPIALALGWDPAPIIPTPGGGPQATDEPSGRRPPGPHRSLGCSNGASIDQSGAVRIGRQLRMAASRLSHVGDVAALRSNQ
jgi:hypothetical protein